MTLSVSVFTASRQRFADGMLVSDPEAVIFYGFPPTLRNFHRWRLRPDPLRPHVTWHLTSKALNLILKQTESLSISKAMYSHTPLTSRPVAGPALIGFIGAFLWARLSQALAGVPFVVLGAQATSGGGRA